MEEADTMMMDVETPEPHKTGHRWVDLLVAICALLVSAISLGVAIFHGGIMEKMASANDRLVEANSWPFLQANPSNADDSGRPMISLAVDNSGVGPAKLHWLELSYRGRPTPDLRSLIAACCRPGGSATPPVALNFSVSTTDSSVIRAGQSLKVFTLMRTPASAAIWDRLNLERLKIGYRACYCSVFDECWISSLQTLDPQQVKACPKPTAPFDALGSILTPAPPAGPAAPAPAGAARSAG